MDSNVSEKDKPLKQMWDKFSKIYSDSFNRNTLTLTSMLMSLTDCHKSSSILDAGCGCGMGTKFLTNDMKSSNSVVYAFDLSTEMIKLAEEVFSKYDDFNSNKNNKYEFVKIDSKINIEEDLKEIRKEKTGKIVKFFDGSVENLPFQDEQFDTYISSLCIMLCNDKDKAINEMFRVLKKGGKAAIAIWGKKELTNVGFGVVLDIFQKHGVVWEGGFPMGRNVEEVVQKFKNAGFSDVRYDYTSVLFNCYDEEDFMIKFFTPASYRLLSQVSDVKKQEEIYNEIKEIAKQKVSNEKLMNTLSILTFVVSK